MSSAAVESGMDNYSLIISLKGNAVILDFLFSSQKSSKYPEPYLTVLDDLNCEPFASSQPCWSSGCMFLMTHICT